MSRFFIVVFTLFFSFNSLAQTTRPTSFDHREFCEKSKGVWRQFGNGCAGSCSSKVDEFAMCTQAITYSCDCGKDRCWDDVNCISLAEYKKERDRQKREQQEADEEQREKRRAEFEANQQQILDKILKGRSATMQNDTGQAQPNQSNDPNQEQNYTKSNMANFHPEIVNQQQQNQGNNQPSSPNSNQNQVGNAPVAQTLDNSVSQTPNAAQIVVPPAFVAQENNQKTVQQEPKLPEIPLPPMPPLPPTP
jgi:hypothetical protein